MCDPSLSPVLPKLSQRDGNPFSQGSLSPQGLITGLRCDLAPIPRRFPLLACCLPGCRGRSGGEGRGLTRSQAGPRRSLHTAGWRPAQNMALEKK